MNVFSGKCVEPLSPEMSVKEPSRTHGTESRNSKGVPNQLLSHSQLSSVAGATLVFMTSPKCPLQCKNLGPLPPSFPINAVTMFSFSVGCLNSMLLSRFFQISIFNPHFSAAQERIELSTEVRLFSCIREDMPIPSQNASRTWMDILESSLISFPPIQHLSTSCGINVSPPILSVQIMVTDAMVAVVDGS
ncbi:uncharacterized protein LOC125314282 [Rhodamnia argentea]|uniref:Uncharacterized protein LOC125314282 n=1 Tax=Rhodamnia argentea TaxID=178133 RepID=A0ABM3H6F6_9MYRT|nr:uncharacterized protein LOC125314282 [Rhodamnia argentea]